MPLAFNSFQSEEKKKAKCKEKLETVASVTAHRVADTQMCIQREQTEKKKTHSRE